MPDQDSIRRDVLLEEENKRLRLAVEELSVLNEIATAIASTQGLEELANLIIQKCVKHLKVEQGAVMLLDERDQQKPLHTMVRKQDTQARMLPYRLDAQLAGWMIKNKTPLLINDFIKDNRFKDVASAGIFLQSLLTVPLLSKGRMIGLISVFNKKTEAGFTSDDQRLLAIIAGQSAQVIENARLYEEEQALFKLQEEMRLAGDIQMNLLPANSPQIAGYDIAGRTIPAKEVGGDYFDYIQLNDHYLAFCLGDVSGKGMPAALLMANLQATLRGQAAMEVSCKICMERSNKLLFHGTDSTKFATLFYGILNAERHELCYSNAGHDFPLLFAAGKAPSRLKTGGVVLGFVSDFTYTEARMTLNHGEVLVLYSDGITEAMNEQEQEFGEQRLAKTVQQHIAEPAEAIINHILVQVREHSGKVPQMDDMTLLIVKRL
jgi:sigma-B regulation protein RsbU (phosphoserine phosphatase)